MKLNFSVVTLTINNSYGFLSQNTAHWSLKRKRSNVHEFFRLCFRLE